MPKKERPKERITEQDRLNERMGWDGFWETGCAQRNIDGLEGKHEEAGRLEKKIGLPQNKAAIKGNLVIDYAIPAIVYSAVGANLLL